ncbi:MAG: alpha-hydroxy-acid oxidizing protein, partial [Candidatus Methanomethylicia archaeon]|nr:alpha-hydroxy-acid oxidizing protein [Candidatus Methanomethylicia archaeon]
KYKGVLKGISSVVRSIGVPVIVKETGCGISKEVAAQLSDAGIAALEVAGAGGTSWAAVEHYNALMNGDKAKAEIAETFWDWGIPTAMSICEAVSARRSSKGKFKVIASGGIKDGIDVAKSLALGADLAGVARPLLIPAFHGHKEVVEKLIRIVHELKITCLLCGCRSVEDLGKAKAVISGGLRDWIEQRGLEIGRVEGAA